MPADSFTAGAWVVGTTRAIHHRTHDHFGVELDTYVELASDIGLYPAGMAVHDVLVSLWGRITGVNPNPNWHSGSFNCNATIKSTGHLSSFTADALKTLGALHVASFSADAIRKEGKSASFSAKAILV